LLSDNVSVAYAVSYLFGTAGVAWFLSRIGPRLLGVDLAAACAALGRGGGEDGEGEAGETLASGPFLIRAFRVLGPPWAGATVGEVEAAHSGRLLIGRNPRERPVPHPRLSGSGPALGGGHGRRGRGRPLRAPADRAKSSRAARSSSDNVQCDLTGPARNRVCLKDRPAVQHHPERKGILAALINRDGQGIDPDLRTPIDIKVAKALSRAMEQAGIRPSQRSRHSLSAVTYPTCGAT
jgi:hypothetical protein